ncbi:hypothetical protein F0A22_21960 [Salmonella enterica]|nr:hypothetical protein [Salmonella enterica]EDN0720648.1 hypothetical protein [Salmonella enterica subsp. enterica serovar Typhimurium]
MSIKNDGHYFCRAGGNRPDGLNEPVTYDVFIRILLFVIPILSSFRGLPGKKSKKIRAGMVITSLAGNKRILLGWSGTEQYYESNVNRNHRLCQGALIH